MKPRANKIIIRKIATIFMLVLLSGCSQDTMREIGEKRKPEIEAVLAELTTIAESIPEQDFDPKEQLDPMPYLHLADPMSNTIMGSRDDFMGFSTSVNDPTYFDLGTFYASYMLRNRFLAQPAEPNFELEIQAFIDVRYAVVYYPVGYRDAEISETEFLVDPLTLLLAMYDRVEDKWIFRKTFKVAPPKQVEFEYGPGHREANAEFEVKRFYYAEVLPQIERYLKEQIDGTIEFNKDAQRLDGTRRWAD